MAPSRLTAAGVSVKDGVFRIQSIKLDSKPPLYIYIQPEAFSNT